MWSPIIVWCFQYDCCFISASTGPASSGVPNTPVSPVAAAPPSGVPNAWARGGAHKPADSGRGQAGGRAPAEGGRGGQLASDRGRGRGAGGRGRGAEPRKWVCFSEVDLIRYLINYCKKSRISHKLLQKV